MVPHRGVYISCWWCLVVFYILNILSCPWGAQGLLYLTWQNVISAQNVVPLNLVFHLYLLSLFLYLHNDFYGSIKPTDLGFYTNELLCHTYLKNKSALQFMRKSKTLKWLQLLLLHSGILCWSCTSESNTSTISLSFIHLHFLTYTLHKNRLTST